MSRTALRQQLEARHTELSARLSALQKDLQQKHSADWAEQAQERENDEVLESLAHECAAELQQIDSVLKKIENGSYGICSGCGCEIDPARLAALPSAHHCVNCAQ